MMGAHSPKPLVRRLLLGPGIIAVMALACASQLRAQIGPLAPIPRQVDHISTWHGERFHDPFFWLRDKGNHEVINYLELENAFTAYSTREMKPFADAVYQELLGHIKQSDLDVPVRRGAYFYYARTKEGKQYPIRCRRKAAANGTPDDKAPEEVILDLNALAVGLKFLSLGAFVVSDDGNLLAYATDTTGFRQYRLSIKDLRTGTVLPDSAERVTSVAWCADNRTLFYTTEDPLTKRSNIVWRHPLGDESDPVHLEKDQLYTVHLARSKDQKMLFVQSRSTDTWETQYLASDKPDGAFRTVLPRAKGHKYTVEHRDGLFYLRTNKGGRNFRLVTAPVTDPSRDWKELLPARDDVLLDGVELFDRYLVVSEKTAALERFRVLDFATDRWQDVAFPESVYAASAGFTPEWTATSFRFTYQSLVTPASVYDYDMATGRRLLRKQDEVPGYDAAHYATERQWAPARDGVKVPLSIVYRKGLTKDGRAPLFLYGYGSYGFGMPASFNSNRLVLLDRGMVYVIAHIRGGNEMGEAWHEDGMLMKKKNTFFDFIDCAEWLIAQKWTSSDRLVIEGASAGGLLMGSVTNLRPDLFRAVHLGVPFVDVLNTMMDASLPLTVGEYLEWGNPNEKAAFDYMRSYSPYDNLEHKAYPAILVTTSLNDSQVMYWEPAKYVAKLRTLKTDDHPLLLKCNMGAGHGGASGRYDSLKEVAFAYAWLMSQANIRK
jgi:oligopeptidase B